jgi:hypothetical protein
MLELILLYANNSKGEVTMLPVITPCKNAYNRGYRAGLAGSNTLTNPYTRHMLVLFFELGMQQGLALRLGVRL